MNEVDEQRKNEEAGNAPASTEGGGDTASGKAAKVKAIKEKESNGLEDSNGSWLKGSLHKI